MTIIPHQKPTPSQELQMYASLNSRMNLSASQKRKYDNLYKGYLGELKFYQLLNEQPSANRLALYDFLLESNETEFQIDSLVIHRDTIYLLEIKNFEGDFYVDGNEWFVTNTKQEIRNPLLQLQRTEFLFKRLLQNINVNFAVKPYVVFVNEEFTLYQSPLSQPIIYPTQLRRFINMLNTNSRPLTTYHTNSIIKLAALHKKQSINRRMPKFEYEQLEKGVVCQNCSSFLGHLTTKLFKCLNCGRNEKIELAIMQSIVEFHLLFPNRKITANSIYDWCEGLSSKRRIQDILVRNLTLINRGRSSHYVFTKLDSN